VLSFHQHRARRGPRPEPNGPAEPGRKTQSARCPGSLRDGRYPAPFTEIAPDHGCGAAPDGRQVSQPGAHARFGVLAEAVVTFGDLGTRWQPDASFQTAGATRTPCAGSAGRRPVYPRRLPDGTYVDMSAVVGSGTHCIIFTLRWPIANAASSP
jgi:hypothetical protein